MGYFNDYIGMSPKEALMTFCDKYFAEGYSTETGVIASYIKRYIEEDSVSIEHHEDELQSLEEDYYNLEADKDDIENENEDLQIKIDRIKINIVQFLEETIENLREKVLEVDSL